MARFETKKTINFSEFNNCECSDDFVAAYADMYPYVGDVRYEKAEEIEELLSRFCKDRLIDGGVLVERSDIEREREIACYPYNDIDGVDYDPLYMVSYYYDNELIAFTYEIG